MAARDFKTVPDALLSCANAITDHFDGLGYKVLIEHSEIEYPNTPTLVCKLNKRRIIVEVDSQIRNLRMQAWVSYGKSCSRDTRVAICLPDWVAPTPAQIAELRAQQVGLYSALPGGITEIAPLQDLAVNLAIPPFSTLPKGVRKLLTDAYDQFKGPHWVEGFKAACGALETEASKYLRRGVASGRIRVLQKGVATAPSSKQIERKTMGQLADAFSKIQTQNVTDSIVGKALSQLYKDRNIATHHKGRESNLRRNVARHVWTIVAALKAILSS